MALQPEVLKTTSLDGVGDTSDGAVEGCVGDIVDGVDGDNASDVGHKGVGGGDGDIGDGVVGDGVLTMASLEMAS